MLQLAMMKKKLAKNNKRTRSERNTPCSTFDSKQHFKVIDKAADVDFTNEEYIDD